MGPIDYTQGFQPVNIAEQIGGGFGIGSGIRNELQRRQDDLIARQKAEQDQIKAMRRAAEYERDLFGVFNDPTPQNMARLQLTYPERIKEFQAGFETMDKARVADEQAFIGKTYAAARSNPEIAAQLLTDRIAALTNSGEDAAEEQRALDLLKTDPKQALGYIGTLAALTLPKDKVEALNKLDENARAEALQPSKLAESEAAASLKAAEAKAAPAKLAADLGLTKAQTTKVMVETKNLSDEAKRAAIQFAAGPAPEKAFDFEQKLRNEYNTQTKEFQEVRSAATRVNAADNSAAGDLSLVYSFMKALDPGSVVRETEFATAQNAAGVPDRVRNIYNKALSGERLTPAQRAEFKQQALSLAKAAETREKEVRSGIERVVSSYKLNPQNVFYTPETPQVPNPPAENPSPQAGGLGPVTAPPVSPRGPIRVDY